MAVSGLATIDGDECPQQARMEVRGNLRVDPWTQTTQTVVQPLSAARGLDIISKIKTGEMIAISSGSIELTVQVEEEVADLSPQRLGVSFKVDPTAVTWELPDIGRRAMVMGRPLP